MEGLAAFTPPRCCICPELSKIFFDGTNSTAQPTTIAGEIDFYLNSSLSWGIELLVNGDGIGEYISRFTPPNGRYVALAVSDYTVLIFVEIQRVDQRIFRDTRTVLLYFLRRMTTQLRQDSSIAQINLSN